MGVFAFITVRDSPGETVHASVSSLKHFSVANITRGFAEFHKILLHLQ